MSNVCGRCKRPCRLMTTMLLAFPHLEAWIISKPTPLATSSGPASEISSVVSGDDFSDRLLVSTSSPSAQQDLVVQVQNGVNMASGTATTAPSTATTAPSTAPLPLTAGPSTIEPIVPIGAIRGSGHAQCHSKS